MLAQRYRVLTPLMMSGVKHGPGAEVELGEIAARELLACGAVELIPLPPAPPGGDGEDSNNEIQPGAEKTGATDGLIGDGAGAQVPALEPTTPEAPQSSEATPPSGGVKTPRKSGKGK